MNNKQQLMLLLKQVIKFLINKLLADYFNSASYKIMLCLAYLEKKSNLLIILLRFQKNHNQIKRKKNLFQKSRLKKSLKSNLNFKIYLLLKYCF